MKHSLLFISVLSVAGCFFQQRQHAVAAPPDHSTSRLDELEGKVEIKGFELFLVKPDGTQIELNTDRIVDTPVTIRGTKMKDGKFQVIDVKGIE